MKNLQVRQIQEKQIQPQREKFPKSKIPPITENKSQTFRGQSESREKQSKNYRNMLEVLQLLSIRLLMTQTLKIPFKQLSKSNTEYKVSNRQKAKHRLQLIQMLQAQTRTLLNK